MYWLNLLKLFITAGAQSENQLPPNAQQEEITLQNEMKEFVIIDSPRKKKFLNSNDFFWHAMRMSLRDLDKTLPALSDNDESKD